MNNMSFAAVIKPVKLRNMEVCEIEHRIHNLEILFEIQKGWHINSNNPSKEYLKPTELYFEQCPIVNSYEVFFPESEEVKLYGEEFSFFQGMLPIDIGMQLQTSDEKNNLDIDECRVKLKYQACNNKICLTPQTLNIDISPLIISCDILNETSSLNEGYNWNDKDHNANERAEENCYDCMDNDCDGKIDVEDENCQRICDQDDDGSIDMRCGGYDLDDKEKSRDRTQNYRKDLSSYPDYLRPPAPYMYLYIDEREKIKEAKKKWHEEVTELNDEIKECTHLERSCDKEMCEERKERYKSRLAEIERRYSIAIAPIVELSFRRMDREINKLKKERERKKKNEHVFENWHREHFNDKPGPIDREIDKHGAFRKRRHTVF